MPRIEVEATCLVRHGADVRRATVHNVSQGGLNIDCEAEIPVGAAVTVTLAGLPPQQGVVAWARSGCLGIKFNNVLGLPTLVQWLHQQAAESLERLSQSLSAECASAAQRSIICCSGPSSQGGGTWRSNSLGKSGEIEVDPGVLAVNPGDSARHAQTLAVKQHALACFGQAQAPDQGAVFARDCGG